MSDVIITRQASLFQGLNFNIIGGTTQPSNPKENTIWVNTDATITSWVFSSVCPSPGQGGQIWIKTGTSSDAAFNAVKIQELFVYPIGFYQYLNDNWVSVTTSIYTGSRWIVYEKEYLDLYNYGDECISITGGWIGNNMAYSGQSYGGGYPTITRREDSLLVYQTGNMGSALITQNPIVFTDYTSLHFLVSSHLNKNNSGTWLGSRSNLGNYESNYRDGSIQYLIYDGVIHEYVFDITNLTGNHYPYFYTYYGTNDFILYKCWLEK